MQVKYSEVSTTEPITATEVKAWLKVDFTAEDTLINALITQIREIAEEASGLALISKTIEYFENDSSILNDWIALPYPSHSEITEVKANGTVTTNYLKTGLSQFLVKIPFLGVISANDAGVVVKYATTGECPNGVKLAMLEAIAETYEKRGNTFEGSAVKLTDFLYNHLQQFKRY